MSRALYLLVYALAAARVTRLIAEDTLLDAPRNAIFKRLPDDHPVALLIGCRWCAGFWVAVPAAAVARFWPTNPWLFLPALALAFSYLIGFLSGHEEN